MDNAPDLSSGSRWDEFRTRPIQNCAIAILTLNAAVLVGFGLTDPDWIESMHVFSLALVPQFVLSLGYFFTRLYGARWYHILTGVYSVCAGLIVGLGWIIVLALANGFP